MAIDEEKPLINLPQPQTSAAPLPASAGSPAAPGPRDDPRSAAPPISTPPGAEPESDTAAAPAALSSRIVFDGPADIRSVALTGLFILALFYTLYFARAVFMPITLALLLNFLFRPLITRLERWHITPVVSSALILILVFGAIGAGVYELSRPAMSWIQQAPEMTSKVGAKLRQLREPVKTVQKAAQQVGDLATKLGDEKKGPQPVVVKDNGPGLTSTVISQTREFFVTAAAVVILLYFLLVYGDFFLRKVIKVMPTLSDKKRALSIAREMEHQISTYLVTVTWINALLGLCVGVALYFIGLPNPALWGLMVGLLNFIPYLGATVGIVIVTVVSMLTFDSLAYSLLAPAAYLAINAFEGSVFTPLVLGHRLPLNPVVIFIWLLLWGWLWGIPGALLAVPMLAALKIFCDHIEPLSLIGEFLGH